MPEIVSINQADQFVGDHTAYACGFFAVMMCTSMAPPGQAATKEPVQISNDALAAYARYNGDAGAGNSAGMSLPQLYSLLHEVGLHYQGTVLDLAHIRAWLRSGFPVIVAVAETCVYDLDLGDRVPYPWNPSGNHVIVLTGLDNENFLVRDSANIAPPNTLRQGPRRYDAQRLAAGLVSATAIVPPWRARPTGDIDPTQGLPMPETPTHLPQGWSDDGRSLYAPDKKFPVVLGFRNHVLTFPGGWEADNWPMEPEHHMNQLEYSNPALGAGQQQVFRKCVLEYLPKENRIVHMWIGQELLALRNKTEVSADLHSQLAALLQTLQPLGSAYATIETLLKEGK
ncbi:MAG: hypothetical protein M3Y39_01045 [Chloroflexota bacterium]|nr:hypothetical protein [Chloroflexota bacterium]